MNALMEWQYLQFILLIGRPLLMLVDSGLPSISIFVYSHELPNHGIITLEGIVRFHFHLRH